MTSYDPPIEDITEFNSSLFNQPQINLTQAQADLLYLSKTKNDTSTATLTTFTNAIRVDGNINTRNIFSTFNAGAHELWGALTGASSIVIGGSGTISIRGVTTFPYPYRVVLGSSFNLYPTLGTTNTVIGVTTATNLQATSAENVIIGSSNIGQGLTTGTNNVLIGKGGDISSGNQNIVSIGNGVTCKGNSSVAIGSSIYSNGSGNWNVLIGANAAANNSPQAGTSIGYQSQISGNNDVSIGNTARCLSSLATSNNIAIGSNALITAGTTGANSIAIGNGATINTNISNSVAIGVGAVASVDNTIVLGRTTETVIIPNRIQFTPATYSFPFASTQQLGYYLKTTGTATGVTSATPKSIVTTASIPVGVWRIDFSVQNSITAGGTITQAQSYISNTLNGDVGTAVAFTGSVVRSHVSEVYATSDVQIITSSLTYQQSTAGVIYLNIVRSFSTGTYSFTGELSVTRIA